MLNLFHRLIGKRSLPKDFCLLQSNEDGQMLKQVQHDKSLMLGHVILCEKSNKQLNKLKIKLGKKVKKQASCRNSTHAAFIVYGKCLSGRVRRFDAPQGRTPLEFAPQGLKPTPTRAFSVAEAMIVLLIGTIILGFSAPMISKQLQHNNFSNIQSQILSSKIDKIDEKSKENKENITQNTTNISNLQSQINSIQKIIEGDTTQKDYDNDIEDLQSQLNSKANTITLNEKISSLNTSLSNKITTEITKLKNNFEEKIKNKLVPSGAIMFFDKTACPDGWTAVTTLYPSASGAFIRNMGEKNRSLSSYQAGAVPDIELAVRLDGSEYKDKYYTERLDEYGADDWGGAIGYESKYSDEYLYVMSSADKKYRAADLIKAEPKVYNKDVKEVRPNNIAFLACRKDDY